MPRVSPATFLPAIALTALAVGIFALWMHPAVLDPSNVGWLMVGSDRGQAMIGLAAYLREGSGAWPVTLTPLLGAPDGTALLLTDSIPLLGILLKPFAAILPDGWQYVGLWYLACLLLHVFFAWKLIRPHAPDALGAWLGTALLTLFPPLLNRWVHASLASQWLILWGLWLFIESDRERRPLAWAALLVLTALIHNYLLLMIGAIWASAVLRDIIRGPGRAQTLMIALATGAIVLAAAATHGVFGNHYASTGDYGAFPMALDAWWNPAHPTYSALIPASSENDGRGFEGLQYLGAGLLTLVLAAAALLAIRRDRTAIPDAVIRLRWLLPAFLVLILLAIGPQGLWRGVPLFTLPVPTVVIDTLDPVRAAGRLAWPVTYALALSAILIVVRWRHGSLILAAALAIQLIDLAPMIGAIRHRSAEADQPAHYPRTPDPRWEALVASAARIDFQPPRVRADLPVMHEVTLRAILACRPVNFTYTARQTPAAVARLTSERAGYRKGMIDPTRLYVLLRDSVPPALADRIKVIDGVAVIPPSARAKPASCE
ncbi:hypothetical protein GCM10009106_01390 [Sphingomonas japonica]|nr:DUF6311 domain-containing protein [Sphingomonas japonica]